MYGQWTAEAANWTKEISSSLKLYLLGLSVLVLCTLHCATPFSHRHQLPKNRKMVEFLREHELYHPYCRNPGVNAQLLRAKLKIARVVIVVSCFVCSHAFKTNQTTINSTHLLIARRGHATPPSIHPVGTRLQCRSSVTLRMFQPASAQVENTQLGSPNSRHTARFSFDERVVLNKHQVFFGEVKYISEAASLHHSVFVYLSQKLAPQ